MQGRDSWLQIHLFYFSFAQHIWIFVHLKNVCFKRSSLFRFKFLLAFLWCSLKETIFVYVRQNFGFWDHVTSLSQKVPSFYSQWRSHHQKVTYTYLRRRPFGCSCFSSDYTRSLMFRLSDAYIHERKKSCLLFFSVLKCWYYSPQHVPTRVSWWT